MTINMKQKTYRIPEQSIKKLAKLAKTKSRSASYLVRKAIDAYCFMEEQKEANE